MPGPSQIANNFGADRDIQDKLLAFTQTNSQAVYGNLLTLPVGDGLLYVAAALHAAQERRRRRIPLLQYVLVSFGEQVGIGTTLTAALDDVLGITSAQPGRRDARQRHRRRVPPGGSVSGDVRALLRQAEADFADGPEGAAGRRPPGLRQGAGRRPRPGAAGPGRSGKSTPSASPSPSSSASRPPRRRTDPAGRAASAGSSCAAGRACSARFESASGVP